MFTDVKFLSCKIFTTCSFVPGFEMPLCRLKSWAFKQVVFHVPSKLNEAEAEKEILHNSVTR